MILTLDDTTSAGINAQLIQARRNQGVASGLVFTMIVVADTWDFDRVLRACVDAGREHPSRIIVIATRTETETGLDATIRMGEDVPGEVITLLFRGELAQHRRSTLVPLLLPDSPIVVWWPGIAPARPGSDPIGELGTRRITDAMGAPDPQQALRERAASHSVGDTDLTWTRLTRWRALLVTALDQYPATVRSVTLSGNRDNAPATLLAAWLANRLAVPVEQLASDGPGITGVVMHTDAGDIAITRTDGALAQFTAPGLPCRTVALRRRDINDLLTEELRRLDTDEVFEATMETLSERYRREGEGA
ncbi:glucose-6-phosphate dehydrogenase assembly protein OpcA [Propionicicella superfundia]|uniref:glucose-6-phosphate dehydrogenase assembly protein OpcA n=1 Tax=Propionicicella superfundia TaxID=348582 RepID=UPI00040DE9E2|nr:glucose-6-phosphate dehydrogenase assembly protein OpcA [Propionicicella superfundia]